MTQGSDILGGHETSSAASSLTCIVVRVLNDVYTSGRTRSERDAGGVRASSAPRRRRRDRPPHRALISLRRRNIRLSTRSLLENYLRHILDHINISPSYCGSVRRHRGPRLRAARRVCLLL
ncbi:unnamed protein product [Euphydryas editha]|uniref:Uncharacterized protein n=1 Tax=Euphydryas editha TaxID=104508 RepID=A0AAU9UQA1_EUPED|nr:unnamed protein product [Euphydryas editha]